MSASSIAYKSSIDTVSDVLLRLEEREWVKRMVDWIYLGADDEVGDIRINQVQLQEDFSQFIYVVTTRVHQIERTFAPIKKAVEEEFAQSAKKLTVDQRETAMRAHEECSPFINTIEDGYDLIKSFEYQLAVLKSRHQMVMERSYEERRAERLTETTY
jgi:hypothetical protein